MTIKEKIKSCGHDQKGIHRISKHLMGNGEGRTLPSGVSAKELAQCFSALLIKKVDNIRSDLQTRQIQMSENVPELPTAMSVVLAYFKAATQRKYEVSYAKLRISHVNSIRFQHRSSSSAWMSWSPLVTAISNRDVHGDGKCANVLQMCSDNTTPEEIWSGPRDIEELQASL